MEIWRFQLSFQRPKLWRVPMAMMSAFDLAGKDGCHKGVVDISRRVGSPRGCKGFGVVSSNLGFARVRCEG